MVVLGKGKVPKGANKVAAPLPLNLPSLKSEQGDVPVSLVPTGGAGWGTKDASSSSASTRSNEYDTSKETTITHNNNNKAEETTKPTTSTPWSAIIKANEPQTDDNRDVKRTANNTQSHTPTREADANDGRQPSRASALNLERGGRSELDQVAKFPTLNQWLPKGKHVRNRF